MATYQKVSLPLFLERKPRSLPVFRVKQLRVFTKPATWNTPQEENTPKHHVLLLVYIRGSNPENVIISQRHIYVRSIKPVSMTYYSEEWNAANFLISVF